MRTSSKKILAFVAVLALTAVSTLALAQTPGRVGRIALIQGQVSVAGDRGDGFNPALLNWPVTTNNQLTTGRDARTEIKIGSTAIRLDGDSSLEVTELDDDTMRLHLHYGSVSVHVRNPEVLQGFRLTTPQGQVRLQEPGRVRVDAERVRDTTVVNVFDGVALVDGQSSSTTVRANRRAELNFDDMRTGSAVRDSFDDWAYLRDQRDERVVSDRYVTREMTGYEDLDQYGVWRDDREYGSLWVPRSVPVNWAPYRDGRWAWVAPWGWTWVDNAPWGYAPFHYGRWVQVSNRWCWAPGRIASRPVWAPALVGWVGGNNWQLSFSSGTGMRPAPATGWYPLSPRHAYTPAYKVAPDHLRWINRNAHPDDHHRGNPDRRMPGLTVVPHDQFGQRGTVVVPNAPRAVVPPVAYQTAAPLAPPPAPLVARTPDRRDDRGPRNDRYDRDERAYNPRNDNGRIDANRFDHARNERPTPSAPFTVKAPLAPAPQPAQPQQRGDDRLDRNDRNDRDNNGRNDRFDRFDRDNNGRGRNERPAAQPAPAMPVVQQPQAQPQPQPQPVPVPIQRTAPPRQEPRDPEDERRHGRPMQGFAAPQQQPQPQVQQQFNRPQPQPQPQFQPPPQPQAPQAAPQSFSRPAPQPQQQAQPPQGGPQAQKKDAGEARENRNRDKANDRLDR